MNNVSQGQNFRPRRNNNNYKKNGSSGGGRQDFRRGSNTAHAFNNQGGGNSHHARHPELDIVIDSRAAQRASTMRDKYQSMARDAQTSGDRVYAEFCLQHTEHYNRILNAYNESRPQPVRAVETSENGNNAQNTEATDTAPQQTAQVVTVPPAVAEEEPYQAAGNS